MFDAARSAALHSSGSGSSGYSGASVLFFDELDSLAKHKSGEGGASETILSQLLTEIRV